MDALNNIPGGEVFISHSRFLAFRAITQTNVDFIREDSNYLKSLVIDKENELNECPVFNSKTKQLVKLLKLTTNECNPSLEDYIRIRNTLITTFYLNLLKAANYFKSYGSDPSEFYQYSNFSPTELLVGSIIEKLLLVVKFNTHEVGQMESLNLFPNGCKVGLKSVCCLMHSIKGYSCPQISN